MDSHIQLGNKVKHLHVFSVSISYVHKLCFLKQEIKISCAKRVFNKKTMGICKSFIVARWRNNAGIAHSALNHIHGKKRLDLALNKYRTVVGYHKFKITLLSSLYK